MYDKCQKLLMYLTNWLQKQSLLYFDTNNCSFIGAMHAILAYHEHLKTIDSSVHKALNTVIASSNPNSSISASLPV